MKEPYVVNIRGGVTERGYTSTMRQNILFLEQVIRNRQMEQLHVFDSKGNYIRGFQGSHDQVKGLHGIPPNSILTHNHPLPEGAKGLLRIGNPFSYNDIATAVALNAKEIRAVTPTYTFSIKRPKQGWRTTSQEVESVFTFFSSEVKKEHDAYLSKHGYSNTSIERSEATFWHDVNKKMAKYFHWNYTKKNR